MQRNRQVCMSATRLKSLTISNHNIIFSLLQGAVLTLLRPPPHSCVLSYLTETLLIVVFHAQGQGRIQVW
jgi:hypothetical protein